jgi:TonB family protein
MLILLLLPAASFAQSGRRATEAKAPGATSTSEQPQAPLLISGRGLPGQAPSQIAAEKPRDYRCAKDGNHNRIPESEDLAEQVLSSRMVDRRVVFRSKPRPGYTLEARRNRKQGFVILKVALSATGTISRVRVLRGLPFGLTESAIKAACKLQFKPAIKNGQTVSQWVTAEYVFRLPDSRLFRP